MPTRKSKRKLAKRKPRKLRRAPSSSSSSTFSTSSVGPAFDKLVAVMARLRAPNGCPWDREQTHATLRTYLIEEAYEVLDALDGADDAKFAEELGDLLLQVLFHAQIASEEGRFSMADVISEIYEKMIRRHPHVFGEKRAKDAAEVLRNWEIIKREEREAKLASKPGKTRAAAGLQTGYLGVVVADLQVGSAGASRAVSEGGSRVSTRPAASSVSASVPESLLDGVPRTLPALLEAYQLTRKAARIGFDWYDIDGIFAKLTEETLELQSALAHNASPSTIRHPERSDPALSSAPGSGAPGRAVEGSLFDPSGRGAPSGSNAGAPPSVSEGGSWVSPSSASSSSIESELGDILFVAVNLARFLDIDPEIALKKTSAKFSRRFREMERLAREQGTTLAQVPRPQMESLWNQVKLREHSASPSEVSK